MSPQNMGVTPCASSQRHSSTTCAIYSACSPFSSASFLLRPLPKSKVSSQQILNLLLVNKARYSLIRLLIKSIVPGLETFSV